MNRSDFTILRDLPGKLIRADIRFSARKQTAPALIADEIEIQNSRGVALRLNVNFNPEVGSKTINVFAIGVGPICRLDVDGPAHRPLGRCHKHSLQNDRCPERNLPDGVTDMQHLSGKTLREVFEAFCSMAKIQHEGTFILP